MLVFDIETNGLDCTEIHCIVTQDIDTGLVTEYNDQATPNYSIANAVNDRMLKQYDANHYHQGKN